MKLRNWHIDGFGVFCDAGLPDPGLGDGINLFVGPNETGKSTLLDFLRYTLFGYPSGNSPLPRREPLNGGNHGGTLVYECADATYNLFRQPGKKNAFDLHDQVGAALTQNDLERHLGHVTSELFRNIFGFSLEELQGDESLKKIGLRDLVFAASMGQSATLIRKVQSALQNQADVVFRDVRKAGANAPRIVKLHAELYLVEQQLDQEKATSRALASKRKELEAKKVTLENIALRLGEVEVEIKQLDRLIAGWPLWVERCQAEKERSKLGDVSYFPIDGDSTWATRKTEFDKAREQAQTRWDDVKEIEVKLTHLPVEFPLLKLVARVEELALKHSDYDIARQRENDAKEKAAQAQRSWEAASEELGPEWPENIVRTFDVSLVAEDEARRLADVVRDAGQVVSQKYEVATNLAHEARTLSAECISKAKQLDNLSREEPLLEAQEVAQLRVRLGEFREALRNRESLRNDLRLAENYRAQVSLYSGQRPIISNLPPWLSAVLVVGAIALTVAAVGFFYFREPLAAVMAAVFSLVLFGLAVLLRAGPAGDQGPDELSPEIRDAQDRFEKATKALQQHDTHWQASAEQANLSWPVTENDLTTLEGRTFAQERGLGEARLLLDELQQLQDKKLKKNVSFRKSKRELLEAKVAHSAAFQEWIEFLGRRQLPKTVQFETAITILERVKKARQALRDLDRYTLEAEGQETKAQSYLIEIQNCMGLTSLLVDEESARVFLRFEELRKQCKEQTVQSRDREGLIRDLRTAKKKLRDAVSIARAARRDLQVFLSEAGVVDEPGFKDLSARSKEHSKLTQTIKEKATALKIIFGPGGVAGEVEEVWMTETLPNWEADRSSCENKKHSLLDEQEATRESKTALEFEINSQLKSEEVARLQLEAEELREEVSRGIGEWLQLATAQELLQRTRDKFERENQSPALEVASRLFKLITAAQYERIIIPLDSAEADLTILTRLGRQVSVDWLSRGTLEQLYLCIRLGYIQHYQKQQDVSLPLLMDDVAVNFDPQRMARTFEVLAECCRQGQQILFFTCHDDLIKLLQPGDRCFRIEAFQFERLMTGPLIPNSVRPSAGSVEVN
jgi:uncharacterized protein YhaN